MERLPTAKAQLDEAQDPEKEEKKEKAQRTKRKALVSPGAISPSGEELERNSDREKEASRMSMRLRERSEGRKKACLNPMALEEVTGDSSAAESWEEIEETDGKKVGKKKDIGEERLDEEEMIEVGNSTERTESEKEIVPWTKKTRSTPRMKKGNRIIISSKEEEEKMLVYTEDETPRKGKQRGSARKQRRKASQREMEESRRKKGSSQIDLTKEIEEEEDMEIVEERKKPGVGKERKMIGLRKEAKSEYEYLGMLTQELKDYAVMLLKDAETVRLKTKTLQGGLSGILKDRITGLRGVIECLIEKLEDKGYTVYYKIKNSELMSENRRLRKEAEKWEQERIMKDREIESYRTCMKRRTIDMWRRRKG